LKALFKACPRTEWGGKRRNRKNSEESGKKQRKRKRAVYMQGLFKKARGPDETVKPMGGQTSIFGPTVQKRNLGGKVIGTGRTTVLQTAKWYWERERNPAKRKKRKNSDHYRGPPQRKC